MYESSENDKPDKLGKRSVYAETNAYSTRIACTHACQQLDMSSKKKRRQSDAADAMHYLFI